MQISGQIVQTLRHVEGQPLPRITLGAVNKDGSLHFAKHFGDDDGTDKQDTDAIHWIASCTKFVTSVALMQCVERGQLKLDEDISTVLPEWKDPKILIGFNEKNEAQFDQRKGPSLSEAHVRPPSIKDITFHLDQRKDLRARRVKFWERAGSELQEVKDFWWPDPVENDLGGGGLYTNVTELWKLYQGFLQGKLLRPGTMEEMFKPQLESLTGLDKPEEYTLSDRNAIYNTIPNNVPTYYGLSGLLDTAHVPGGRAPRSLTWSGYPNCYWWVETHTAVAGVYLSQLQPMGDQKTVDLLVEFEKAVYAAVSKL